MSSINDGVTLATGEAPRRYGLEGRGLAWGGLRRGGLTLGMMLAIVTCITLGSEARARAAAAATTVAAAACGSDDVSRQKTDAPALAFNGAEYFHRWSQKGQHEFTPRGDEDLSAWKDMVTINVHDGVRTGDGLAEVANAVLGNYKAHGHIMRTLSKPRTEKSEAEHFAVATLQGTKLLEVAFARFLLFEGRGVVVVYSKRFYGDDALDDLKVWFKANAIKIENVLTSWDGIPSLATLNKLPATPR